MRAYVAQLKRLTETADKPSSAYPTAPAYIPLETQIQQLMASLPENQRMRDWSMADLLSRLTGKYRDRPHAMTAAAALLSLGWSKRRDFSDGGGGRRVWRHPG